MLCARVRFVSMLVVSVGCLAISALAQHTLRENVQASGAPPQWSSLAASISGDGRLTSFQCKGLTSDSMNQWSIYVRDRATGVTELASVALGGVEANDGSSAGLISGDGRFVVFESSATNLVASDLNGKIDCFGRDRLTGQTELISVSSTGVQGNGDGLGVYSVSSDGRFVLFSSKATTLVSGDANGLVDSFLRDRLSGTTELVAVASNGAQANNLTVRGAVSPDGRYVAFSTVSNNLVTGDTNGWSDTFIRDRQTGTTTRVVGWNGLQLDSNSYPVQISANGLLTIRSAASNFVANDMNSAEDIFVHVMATGVSELVSLDSAGQQVSLDVGGGRMSADGRFVTLETQVDQFVPGDISFDFDVFVRDRVANTVSQVSVDSVGLQGNGQSRVASISDDGAVVVFGSTATNLVPDDTGLLTDTFVHDSTPLQCSESASYCVSLVATQNCLPLLATVGTCSASASSGFTITAHGVPAGKSGIFVYSTTGAHAVPFSSGFLCIKQPIVRTPPQGSGGTNGCTGVLAVDFNTVIAAGTDPNLVAGAQFWGQFWYRASIVQATSGLTHGVTTIICP